MAFEARGLTNDPALNLRLALASVGLALAREDVVRPYIKRGELVSALEEFSTPFPGFHLYYPARRQASPALRALIGCLLQPRQSQPPVWRRLLIPRDGKPGGYKAAAAAAIRRGA